MVGMDFGIEIRYEVNGRQVSREEWVRSFEDELAAGMAEVVEQATADVRALRCPEHDQSPQVTVVTENGGTRMQIETCCEDLERRALEVAGAE